MSILVAVGGCGSRSHRAGNEAVQNNGPVPRQQDKPGGLKADTRSHLVSELPGLAGKPAGTEFEFILRATLTEPVFQGSARITYDSSLVEPLTTTRGKDLPGGEIVLARTDAAPGTLDLSTTDRDPNFDGCVPFAFTARPGGPSLAPGGAELLRVKFRLKRASPNVIPVRLQNDPQSLQLRNDKGQRITFDLDREAAAQ